MKKLVYLILIILALLYVAGQCSEKDSNETSYIPTSLDAINYSQEKIKKLLKSPSTAEFPPLLEKSKHVSGSYPTFTINSWVDSQNGFGAMIRTHYSCEVFYTTDDKVGIRNIKIE